MKSGKSKKLYIIFIIVSVSVVALGIALKISLKIEKNNAYKQIMYNQEVADKYGLSKDIRTMLSSDELKEYVTDFAEQEVNDKHNNSDYCDDTETASTAILILGIILLAVILFEYSRAFYRDVMFPILGLYGSAGFTLLCVWIFSDGASILGGLGIAFGIGLMIWASRRLSVGISKEHYKRTDIKKYNEIVSEEERQAQERKRRKVEEIERERLEAEASQSSNVPWEKRFYTHPCPYCGHYKVRPAVWNDKKMSVAFWGVWSPKIGDQFKCEHCSRTWRHS